MADRRMTRVFQTKDQSTAGWGVSILIGMYAVALMTGLVGGDEYRWLFTGFLLVLMLWAMRLARARVVASSSGVLIINPLRTHSVEWADVSQFEVAAPAAFLVCVDGHRIRMWGIQARNPFTSPAPTARVATEVANLAAYMREAKTE